MRPQDPSADGADDTAPTEEHSFFSAPDARASSAAGPTSGDDVVALAALLGSTDPADREDHALPLLLSWVEAGALDDVLPAVGDGMASGLLAGLGSTDVSSALRRAASVELLGAVVLRATRTAAGHDDMHVRWADAVFAWILRERFRGPLPSPTRVTSPVGHGAVALMALAGSPALDLLGLTVLVDVVADLVLTPQDTPAPAASDPREIDLLAAACVAAIHRDLYPAAVLSGWVRRLANDGPATVPQARDLVRAVHLRLALGTERPAGRADLLLDLGAAVRATSPDLFTP